MKTYDTRVILFTFDFIFTILLLVFGIVTPPPGIIDGSVLTACGILFAFGLLIQLPSIVSSADKVDISTGNSRVSIDMKVKESDDNSKKIAELLSDDK